MMKYIRLFLTGLLFVSLASCDNQDEFEIVLPQDDAGKEVCFHIGINTPTRAATDAEFKTRFEEGDAVGVFILKSGATLQATGNYEDNRKLVYSAGEWILEGDKIYSPTDGSSLNFYAYYPYVETVDPTQMIFEIEDDQQEEAMYNRSDLLLAQAENQSKSTVELQFTHALSLVQVEVVRGKNMVAFDSSLTVTLQNCSPSATVNLVNGTAVAQNTTVGNVVMKRVDTDPSATKYNYRALVPAQSLTAGTEIFFFTQETMGKEINSNYIEEAGIALSGGNISKWKITLNGEELPEHNYTVGDVYPFTGTPLGLVFEVYNDGKNGKIVSLQELSNRWGSYPKDELADGITLIRDADNGKEASRNLIEVRKEAANFATDYAIFHWLYYSMNGENIDGEWYAPSKNELRSLYAAMSGMTYAAIETSWIDGGVMPSFDSVAATAARWSFDEKMVSHGGTAFNLNGQYWASTEVDGQCAWSVHFGTGVMQATKFKHDAWGRLRPIMNF